VSVKGTNPVPKPKAVRKMAGITCPTYSASRAMVESHVTAAAHISMPDTAINRGASFATSFVAIPAESTIPNPKGNHASPVCTGL
jgi:hypothetical protein